jgi:dethiobiotin synthetase
VFVTGTDTEVGKTIVAAAIAANLAARGERVGVFKPAVTGLAELCGELPDHEVLRIAARSSQTPAAISPYRFKPAVSPHLAAALTGTPVDRLLLLRAAQRAAAGCDALVAEGVGGLLVPLAPDYLVRDFAVDLGLPLVVAARATLGTINHTLMTLESARSAGLEVAAVVLTPWPEEPSEVERSNRDAIARLGSVKVETLGRLNLDDPRLWPPLDPFG